MIHNNIYVTKINDIITVATVDYIRVLMTGNQMYKRKMLKPKFHPNFGEKKTIHAD